MQIDKGKIDALQFLVLQQLVTALVAQAQLLTSWFMMMQPLKLLLMDGLTIVEVTNPKTNDTITVGNNALYRAYFDANGNGQRIAMN